jgi:PIN domain.
MKCNTTKDITTFSSINNTRSYFLDTNVLYWYTYPRIVDNLPKNAEVYYNFVDSLVVAGNPLYTSIYNLTELLNVIEKNEYELYTKIHPDIPYTRKDYRKIPKERSALKEILSTALENAKSTCNILTFQFELKMLDDFVVQLSDHRCDIFDYAILKNCITDGKINIISDDSDFSTMESINLYTANPNSLH